MLMTPVGFVPAQLALVELESTPLDHSGKVSGGMTFGVVCAMHGRSRVSRRARCTASGNNAHGMHSSTATLRPIVDKAQHMDRDGGSLQFAAARL